MAPTTVATPTPLPPPAVVVQEATPVATEVVVPTTYVGFVVAPLLNVDVATTSAPTVLPPSLSTLMVSPSAVLAVVASPSLSSRLHIFLDHLYTSMMLTHCGVQLTSRSRRPELVMCQPLIRTLLG